MSDVQKYLRKRGNKKHYRGGHRKLEVGMQGILITCNMNERKCTAEALNLLDQYADQLYGPEKFNEGGSSEEKCDEYDVEAALKKEVAQLKASKEKQQRRFQAFYSGANNVIFIRTQNLEPDKLVHHILSDLHTTKKEKSRVILRMLPVSGTCKAFQENMEEYLVTFLEPWFKTPSHATYQIAFKARNSSHSNREEIIESIAGLVRNLNPKNKVDLTNPELTIIVGVIKTVCCVSVVHDYALYRKYNVQEVLKEEVSKPDVATAKKDVDATDQEEKNKAVVPEQLEKMASEEVNVPKTDQETNDRKEEEQ